MENRNKILSQFFRARTWVAVLIAMQLVFVIPQISDEAEATTWDTPYIVASGSVLTQMAMAVEGDNVYCVYVADNRGLLTIVMRWYNGTAWSPMLTLTPTLQNDVNNPDIAVSNGTAHITYVDHTDRDSDVMYRSFDGSYFSTIQQVSGVREYENSLDPAIAADGDHVFIVWEEVSVTDTDINYRYIFEGRLGVTGTLNSDVGDNSQADPAVAMDDGKAHVVWTDRRNGDADIYYRMWSGGSWATEVNLIPVVDRNDQEYPDIDVEGDDVYVVYRKVIGVNNYGINMVTYTNLRWGMPNGIPGPSGTEHLPRLGVEAGHIALVYLNIDRYYSAYFQLYDGQSWGAAEALETGDIDHIYWPPGVELVNGRAHAMVYDETPSSKIHRYYVADLDEAEPSAEVADVSPYWMALNRISLAWSASDDYGLDSVTVQYRYSEDKAVWDRWTVVSTIDDVSGTDASGTVNFVATEGEGFYEFKAYARDISGKAEAPTTDPEAEAAWDRTAPTGSIVINGGDSYTSDQIVNLTMTWSDSMTELNGTPEQIMTQVSLDGVLWEPWTPAVRTLLYPVLDTDGTKAVYYRMMDASGMVSETYNDTIELDKAAPSGTIVINGGDEWAKTRDVMLNLTYQDAGSGVSEIRISNDMIGGDEPWENPVETKQWTLPEGDGTATVYYQVMDNVGLMSEVFSASISLDTVAPTGSIIMGGSDTITSERTVTLTLTYDDTTSGVAGIRISDEIIGDDPWDNPAPTMDWDLGTESGLVTIYYQVIDVAGMVSEIYSVSITLDAEDPTGSIALSNGATLVNTVTVSLTLSFDDETSNVVGIRVQEEAVGGDEPWDNPLETLEFTLSAGDGEKTIHYQVLDEAGRESQVYSISFTLDTSNPFVESTDPDDSDDKVGVDTDIVVRFSEPMDRTSVEAAFMLEHTEDGTQIKVDGTFTWSPDMRTLTYAPSADLKKGTDYTLSLTTDASDEAGNGVFPAGSYTFTTETDGNGNGGGGGGGGEDDEGNLLLIMVAVMVLAVAVIMGMMFYMKKMNGPGGAKEE